MKLRFDSSGMRTFRWIWLGQTVSILGTSLGSFALGVWLFKTTGSATRYSMMYLAAALAGLVVSPVAGVLSDRFDRRKVMMLSDLGAGLTTLAMAWALFTGRMETWHVYLVIVVMLIFNAFQYPALAASVSLLVSKDRLTKANGLLQMSGTASQIVAPLLAGSLVGLIGYHGVIAIDVSTFFFSILILLLVRFPRPAPTVAPATAPEEPTPKAVRPRRSLVREAFSGWSYLRGEKGLLSLVLFFAATNFTLGIVQVLVAPLVLSFSSPTGLGTVSSAGAVGALLGSLALSVLGGPRNRILTIFACLLLRALILLLGGLKPSVPLVAAALAVVSLTQPIVTGCTQAIWQSKVPSAIQGRIFAMAHMIRSASMPLAYLISGPLADRVFEPMLMPGGTLADSVGRVIGVGPGRGVGFLFMMVGTVLIGVIGLFWSNPNLRQLDREVSNPAANQEVPAVPHPTPNSTETLG